MKNKNRPPIRDCVVAAMAAGKETVPDICSYIAMDHDFNRDSVRSQLQMMCAEGELIRVPAANGLVHYRKPYSKSMIRAVDELLWPVRQLRAV